MPVAEPSTSPGRQAILVGLGALVAIATIVFMASRLGSLGTGETTVDASSTSYALGEATELADAIASEGPLLIPDASGGGRDVWIQHLGDDPTQGWLAFAVRPEGVPQDCFANWDAPAAAFVDTCNGTTYPADGEGLRRYPVSVNEDNNVQLTLGLG